MAIYWEAKSCGREDTTAVGWVVLNRLADADFPADVCAVVKQGGERPNCQFSWWCDGKSDRPEDDEDWRRARELTDETPHPAAARSARSCPVLPQQRCRDPVDSLAPENGAYRM